MATSSIAASTLNGDTSDPGIPRKSPIDEKGSEPGEHITSLEERFNLLSICGIAVTTGESWIVLGNSLTFAINNGGAPGTIYGFIVESIMYWIVAASIAELASSMPSSGTVYYWATISGGRYGRICGWFAGWWNFFAWTLGVASLVSFMSLQVIAIYAMLHPNFSAQETHIFYAFLACTWTCCLLVLFGNKVLPFIESTGAFFTLAGFLISVVVCTAMPKLDGYATNDTVWRDWTNRSGWSSDGLVFCLGLLNAASAVCAPDIPSHLAEEMPNPEYNVPLAILAQYVASFVTGLLYLITLFYCISDFEAILEKESIFPLSLIYLQATNRPATVGLLVATLIPTFIGTIGGFTVAGRSYWALARDRITPWPVIFARLDKSKAPFNSTLLVGVLTTGLGCIYLGSARAFNDIAGSFVVLTSLSYLSAILPHLLGRRSTIVPGPFWMPGIVGYIINAISCLYLGAFVVIFCLPASLPVTAANMNYTGLIVGGFSFLAAGWWIIKRKEYSGPSNLPAENCLEPKPENEQDAEK